ncbi:MetQ/NlpA family ABC transporter substrate-binding protein [Alkalihalobacillus sp. AL-G]|uniref:MetQ/NlpA family ABC transporter substrate-binding protein n=1 Tax=Alkalihalobacillus sp. AL-G TaxID=2926399 RepID=UPI00272D75F6|nr:MetQ/NlpA family ABC transporter substrate-binding protein [Alkalihalobacillus sp. AL-G]WLD92719.1 MetQ/NlpA family ABC transporter substrate-binding protein [Alkalihalobacillus sp. AL-G]
MKKLFLTLSVCLGIIVLAACGNSGVDEDTLVVGASNVPHAEILEEAKPILEEKGIKLEVETFQDYVLPNKALANGEIDANYFQHIPYLKSQMEKNENYSFANAGGIHIEPIGVYSQEYDSLGKLPEGAEIIMSNSVADHGRMLSLLEKEGLIKLKDGIEKTEATVDDIVENSKNLEFRTDVEAGLLPKVYKNGEGDAVLINTNYAIDAGLDPKKDAIALEGSDSPYVNIIAVNKGDEDNEQIQTLVEVLRSEEIQTFIKEEYNGSVVPVSE